MATMRLFLGLALFGFIAGCDNNTAVVAATEPQIAAVSGAPSVAPWESIPSELMVSQWAENALRCYDNAALSYLEMDAKTQEFLSTPSQTLLRQLQNAWRSAHQHFVTCQLYQQGVSRDWQLVSTLRAQLDAWPVMGGYIDAIPGYPDTGIINDSSIAVSTQTLIEQHQLTDTTDVTLGFHAIEFLLWGEDLQRSYTDYIGSSPEMSEMGFDTNPENRRRTLLRETMTLLLVQTHQLQGRWQDDPASWRTTLSHYAKEQQATYLYKSMLAYLNGLNKRFFDPNIQGDLFLIEESPFSHATRDGLFQSLHTFQTELTQWVALYRTADSRPETQTLLDAVETELQALMVLSDQLPRLNPSTIGAWQTSASSLYGQIRLLGTQLTVLGNAAGLAI